MIDNKTIVLTGASSGIGFEALKLLAQGKGNRILAVARHVDNIQYFADNVTAFSCDISTQEGVDRVFAKAEELFGKIDLFYANAGFPYYEEFNYALRVGVTAPFMLTKLFMSHFGKGAAVVNISSSRDRMSQPQTESYTAAKGGIAALTHALAVSLAGKARVNSISPGWIETRGAVYSGPDADQHPAGRVGRPEDIANAVRFLCSEKAGFITGENICIDGGMTRLMIYNDDYGWSYSG